MRKIEAVVFDLYGTLYDVHSVSGRCEEVFPDYGMQISILWRQKQLEYTWLRSLMGQYISFEQATKDALIYTCNHLKLALNDLICAELCTAYLRLAPYSEVPFALAKLKAMQLPLAILSNGSTFSIKSVVTASNLEAQFDHLLSVETVKVFKPDFRVYELACRELGLNAKNILFVSSNPWDASGAAHFGFNVCWINRKENTFDELGVKPNVIISRLDELPDIINSMRAQV